MENEFCWFVVAMIYKHRRGKMVYDRAANFTRLGHKITEFAELLPRKCFTASVR